MHKEERMTQPPMQCLVCLRGNTPDDPDTLDEFWVLDLERDVNWGDPTYLCKYCCEKIALLTGFVSMDDFAEVQGLVEIQKTKLHDLQAELELRKKRINRILKGRKAEDAERKRRNKAAA